MVGDDGKIIRKEKGKKNCRNKKGRSDFHDCYLGSTSLTFDISIFAFSLESWHCTCVFDQKGVESFSHAMSSDFFSLDSLRWERIFLNFFSQNWQLVPSFHRPNAISSLHLRYYLILLPIKACRFIFSSSCKGHQKKKRRHSLCILPPSIRYTNFVLLDSLMTSFVSHKLLSRTHNRSLPLFFFCVDWRRERYLTHLIFIWLGTERMVGLMMMGRSATVH